MASKTDLVIVESPSKAKTIGKYLGPGLPDGSVPLEHGEGGEHPAGRQLVSVPDDPGHDAALHVADDLEIDGDALLQRKALEGDHGRSHLPNKVYYFHNTVLTVL